MTRGVLVGFVAGFASLGLAHCGGDDESASERTCKRLLTKLRDCGMEIPVGAVCNTSPEAQCASECMVETLSCPEIMSGSVNSNYFRCFTACAGIDPNSFLCASGDAYVPPEGVCNGLSECPDGSDEASCGAPDAGPG